MLLLRELPLVLEDQRLTFRNRDEDEDQRCDARCVVGFSRGTNMLDPVEISDLLSLSHTALLRYEARGLRFHFLDFRPQGTSPMRTPEHHACSPRACCRTDGTYCMYVLKVRDINYANNKDPCFPRRHVGVPWPLQRMGARLLSLRLCGSQLRILYSPLTPFFSAYLQHVCRSTRAYRHRPCYCDFFHLRLLWCAGSK